MSIQSKNLEMRKIAPQCCHCMSIVLMLKETIKDWCWLVETNKGDNIDSQALKIGTRLCTEQIKQACYDKD